MAAALAAVPVSSLLLDEGKAVQPAAVVPQVSSSAAKVRFVTGNREVDRILSGTRRFVIRDSFDDATRIVVGPDGRLGTARDTGGRSSFMLTPVGGGWQIKSARSDVPGATSCLSSQKVNRGPVIVVATKCNPDRRSQLFTVIASTIKPIDGRPTYIIQQGAEYLMLSDEGLVISGTAGGAPTPYNFVDRGPV